MQNKTIILSALVLLLGSCQPTAPTPIPAAITTPTQAASSNPVIAPTRAPASPTQIPPTLAPAAPQTAAAITEANINSIAEIAQAKTSYPSRLIWSLDGQSLAVVTETGFSILSKPNWQVARSIAIKQPAILLDLSPDLNAFIQTSDQKTLEVRDPSGALLRTLKPALGIEGANYSPDGKMIAIASVDEISVTLWDASSGQQTKKLSGFQTAAPVYSARIASDNKTLLWISRATIQLMDIASGKLGASFSHEDFVMDEAVTPDGRTLITAAEGTIDFWDVASGKKSKMNLTTNPTTLSLAPGGRVLAAGSEKNVLLWDATTQKQLRALSGHPARVTVVSFSRDGSFLASASEDGVIKVWGVK